MGYDVAVKGYSVDVKGYDVDVKGYDVERQVCVIKPKRGPAGRRLARHR